MKFKKREPAILEGATWDQERMEQFKSPQHKLNTYNAMLKEYGKAYADTYAEMALIKGNLEKFLPKCDPWRDGDNCDIFCNYYSHTKGCLLLYED